MAAIHSLDGLSIHSLTSGQVITSLASAVKELVENSLDAGATSIDVRLLGPHGTNGLVVLDNGSGIPASDYDAVAKKHYTSKLSTFEDLSRVRTFGFRGEALASLCGLAEKVTITTAVESDAPLGTILELGLTGNVIDKTKKVARQKGTTVQAMNLFHSLPVRRKHFVANAKRDFPKLLLLLTAYALVPCTQENRGVRLSVSTTNDSGKNSKSTLHLRTSGQSSLPSVISTLWGAQQLNSLSKLDLELSVDLNPSKSMLQRSRTSSPNVAHNIDIQVRGYLSNPLNHGSGRAQADRQFYYINGRPCNPVKIQKATNEMFRSLSSSSSASSSAYPVVIADFILPVECMDINVSPDKRTILLHGEDALIVAFKDALGSAFSSTSTSFIAQTTQAQKAENKDNGHEEETGGAVRNGDDQGSACENMMDEENCNDDELDPYPRNSPISDLPSRHPSQLGPPQRARGTSSSRPTSRPTDSASKQIQVTLSTASASWNRRSSDIDNPKSSRRRSRSPSSEGSADGNDEEQSAEERMSRAHKKAKISITDYYSTIPATAQIREVAVGSVKGDTARVHMRGMLSGFASQESRISSRNPQSDDLDNELAKDTHEVDKIMEMDKDECVDADANIDLHASAVGAIGPSEEPGLASFGPTTTSLSQFQDNFDGDNLFLASHSSPSPRASVWQEDIDVEDGAEKIHPSESSSDIFLAAEETEITLAEAEGIIDNETDPEYPIVEVLRSSRFSSNTQSQERTVRVDMRRLDDIYSCMRRLESKAAAPHPPMKSVVETNASKSARVAAKPTLSLRVIHKHDFISATTINSDLTKTSHSQEVSTKDGMHIIGQFNRGFIIVRLIRGTGTYAGTSQDCDGSLEDSNDDAMDDLFIIDQHAADEKYNFETLQATTRIDTQRLVRPRPLELTAADELLAIENADILRENGFEISIDDTSPSSTNVADGLAEDIDMGNSLALEANAARPSRVKLVSQPVSGKVVFDMKDLEEILHLLHDGHSPSKRTHGGKSQRMVRCSKARAMFASRACRKSVMIGMALKRSQMLSIVSHMGTMEQPWNCPHGRPTMRHLVGLQDIGVDKNGAVGYMSRSIAWSRLALS